MSSFKCIFIYTFLKQIRSAAFRVVTGAMVVAIILIFTLTKLLNDSKEKITINVIDETDLFSNIIQLNEVLELSKVEVVSEKLSDNEVRKFVDKEKNNVVIKLFEDSEEYLHMIVFDNFIINSTELKVIEDYVNTASKYMLFEQLEIDDNNKEKLLAEAIVDVIQIDTSFEDSYLIGYAFLMLLVLSIMMYGSQVAGEITYTKTNRVMEVILTSVTPRDIFIGTTVAVGLAGLVQLGIIVLAGIAGYFVIKPEMVMIAELKLDFSIISYDKIIVYIVFFVLSYLLYAVLNAGIGSLVSKNEDIMVAVLPITLVSCVQMFTGLMIIASPDSAVAKFFSYFPFTSAGTMLMDYFMGNASFMDIIVSILILLISVVVSTYVAIRVFVNGVIYYGNLSLKSVFNIKGGL